MQRYWLTVAFIGGFVTDLLLLNQVDDVLDNIILLTYVTLSFVAVTLLYLGVANRVGDEWSARLRWYAPILVQYAFGGLLSGMLIFYGRSGDWLVSAPLLLLFVVVIAANELLRHREARLVYNLMMLFVGLVAYTVLVVPVVLGAMGPWVFILSCALAAVVMYWFVQLLGLVIPRYLARQMRWVVFTLGSVLVGYQFLYFTNVIPPIPLSLNQVGVYYEVERRDDVYYLIYEPSTWWRVWRTNAPIVAPEPGTPLYCFSSVFAPTRLATEIEHSWQYKSPEQGWVEQARIGYPIRAVGARGYRGYTQITSYQAGQWRCSVETARGQVLGRTNFTIDPAYQPEQLETRTE